MSGKLHCFKIISVVYSVVIIFDFVFMKLEPLINLLGKWKNIAKKKKKLSKLINEIFRIVHQTFYGIINKMNAW